MRILLSLVVSSEADLPTCLKPPMAVTLTHCSPPIMGRASFFATRRSISCLSSLYALRYPRTSEIVLDGMGGVRITLTFHPVSCFRLSISDPSSPLTTSGFIASTVASPVSSLKNMSNIPAVSGIMERSFSSTTAGSPRVEGSGLMSTLLWRLCARSLAALLLPDTLSYSFV